MCAKSAAIPFICLTSTALQRLLKNFMFCKINLLRLTWFFGILPEARKKWRSYCCSKSHSKPLHLEKIVFHVTPHYSVVLQHGLLTTENAGFALDTECQSLGRSYAIRFDFRSKAASTNTSPSPSVYSNS